MMGDVANTARCPGVRALAALTLSAAIMFGGTPVRAEALPPTADATEIAYWQSIDKWWQPAEQRGAELRAYLSVYPEGAFSDLARLKLEYVAEQAELEREVKAWLSRLAEAPPAVPDGDRRHGTTDGKKSDYGDEERRKLERLIDGAKETSR